MPPRSAGWHFSWQAEGRSVDRPPGSWITLDPAIKRVGRTGTRLADLRLGNGAPTG
jgi:hypothetical protein